MTVCARPTDTWITNTCMLTNHILGQSHLLFHGGKLSIAKAEKVDSKEINHIEQTKTESNNLKDNPDEWLSKINCPEEHTAQIRKLLKQNRDVFALSDFELTQTDTVTMDITTTTDKPIRQKPYFTPLKNRPIVDKAIDNMLAANIIRPSVSPWSSPIVIVPKKDGSKRFCVDF